MGGAGFGTLNVADGFTNNGLLLFNNAGNATTLNVAGSQQLINAGTVQAIGGNANTLNAEVTNNALFDVDADLSVTNAGRTFDTANGTLDLAAGRRLIVNDGTVQFDAGTTFSGTGTLTFGNVSSILDLAANFTLGAGSVGLDFANTTTIQGAGIFTNQDTLTLSNDTLNTAFDNQGTVVVPTNNTSNINGALTTQIGSTIEIQSVGGAGSGTLNVADGFTNNGLLLFNNAGNATTLNVAGSQQLINTGTVQAIGGNTNTLNAEVTNNALFDVDADLSVTNAGRTFDTANGILDLAAGRRLIVNDGTVQFDAGTTLSGTGTLTFGNVSSILDLAANLTLGAGSVGLDLANTTTIQGAGILTNQDTLTLSNDTINTAFDNQGTVVVPTNNTSNINGALTTQAGSTIEIQSVGGAGSGILNVADGFTNNGLLLFNNAGNNTTLNVAGSNQLINTAGGTIRATGGSANTLDAEITNTGLVDLLAGLTITNAGRTFSHEGGNIDLAAAQTLTVNGGTFAWNSGFLTGAAGSAINLTGGAAFSIGGVGAKTLNGLTLNTTNATIGGTGTLNVQSGTLQDTANLTVGNGATVNVSGGSLIADTLTIDGTVAFNSGTLTTTNGMSVSGAGVFNLNTGGVFTPGIFNNNGTVNINNAAAILNLTQNGAHGSLFTVANGAELRFTGGTHTFTSGCTVQGAGNTTLDGATWAGGGTVTLNTAFNWNSGTMSAGGSTVANQGMNIGGGITLDRSMTHSGNTVWNTASNFNGSGTLTNTGTFTVANTQTFSPTFVNNGSFIKTGLGTSTFTNALTNNGTLAGTGTLATNLNNNGVINAGASPGLLTIGGNLTLGAGSVINAELGGTNPVPPEFDIIDVTGTPILDGTLNVSLFGSFIGTPGVDTFNIITFAPSAPSDFLTFNQPSTHNFGRANTGTSYLLSLLGVTLALPPVVSENTDTTDEIVILEQNLFDLIVQFAISEQEEALQKALPAVNCQ